MQYDQYVIDSVLACIPQNASCYLFGSRVYETHDSQSDHDFQIVVYSKDYHDTKLKLNKINKRVVDLHLHTFTDFENALARCEIYALESICLPDHLKFRDHLPFVVSVDKAILRRSISQIASNSWVKAKKKLIVAEDKNVRLAMKSLFHSLRILDFGCQLAANGRIENFQAQHAVWFELQQLEPDWEIWNTHFKPLYNNLASRFRIMCPL
jgi:hypothetical protein